MRACPAIVVPAATLWLALVVAAQQPAEPPRTESPFGIGQRLHVPADLAEPKYTLWVAYPNDRGDFRDHVQYLTDLQRRFAERGIAIAVAMPAPEAKQLAARKPAFTVAAIDSENGATPQIVPMQAGGLVPDTAQPEWLTVLCRG